VSVLFVNTVILKAAKIVFVCFKKTGNKLIVLFLCYKFTMQIHFFNLIFCACFNFVSALIS
jgi:hypothetical protein